MKYTIESSGAFVTSCEIEPSSSGPLDGLRFAVKDLIDVAGYISGCGNPTWRDTHPPAVANAVCVDLMLQAGARCIGKTVTDELAFGLDGENYFYGTPLNPQAPDRVPGGSSSGSASAVACGLADFALGTDTGGSVRIPANNCGLYGIRPSHDRASLAGVMPFALTYDTVGVLAANSDVLSASARVLLGCEEERVPEVGTVHVISEGFECADEDVRAALDGPMRLLRERFGGSARSMSLREIDGQAGAEGFDPWFEAFFPLQWAEIWSTLGPWIEQTHPAFGPRAGRSFGLAKGVDRSRITTSMRERERLHRAVQQFMGPNDLLCMPTSPALAPVKGTLPLDRSRGGYFSRVVSYVSVSGIARLPQVTMPLVSSGGVPVGLSLLAAHGRDAFLLDVVQDVARALETRSA